MSAGRASADDFEVAALAKRLVDAQRRLDGATAERDAVAPSPPADDPWVTVKNQFVAVEQQIGGRALNRLAKVFGALTVLPVIILMGNMTIRALLGHPVTELPLVTPSPLATAAYVFGAAWAVSRGADRFTGRRLYREKSRLEKQLISMNRDLVSRSRQIARDPAREDDREVANRREEVMTYARAWVYKHTGTLLPDDAPATRLSAVVLEAQQFLDQQGADQPGSTGRSAEQGL